MITRKTKLYGVLSLVFFCSALIGVFLMWQYVQKEGEELLRQTKEVADFSAQSQSYRELEELVSTTKADRDELSSYILTEEKTIDFLAYIEEIAIEQDVELTTNSLKVIEGAGLFDTLVISYAVEGTQSHVDKMLLIFETLPYHTFVSSISLTYSSDDDGPSDKVDASIELTVSLLNYDR